MPITGQHISSHSPAAKLQHFRMILTVQDSGYRIKAGTSVALTALYIMKICKECPMRELLDLALQAHGGRSRRMEAEGSNGRMNMSRYISKSVSLLTLTVVICGGLYPLSLWVIGQAIFPFQANSSMLNGPDSKVVGSRQIAQPFTKDEYFQPRPSAASYDASASTSSAVAASNNIFDQSRDFGAAEDPS